MLTWLIVGWVAVAVLGWSWLAAAARADREQPHRRRASRRR
jgi:hypothetical protein